MSEKIHMENIEEAEKFLRQHSTKEDLENLPELVDAPTLKLLAAIAVSLSWNQKNSDLSSFALTHK